MNKGTEAILALKPVTFHYKSDVKDAPQFGSIAEGIAKVNPALVLHDKERKPTCKSPNPTTGQLTFEIWDPFARGHSADQNASVPELVA